MVDEKWPRLMHENSIHGLTFVGEALEGAAVDRVGPWLLFDSGTGSQDLDQAIVAGNPVVAAADLGTAEAWFEGRGRGFSLWLREPGDREVIAAVTAAGFRELRTEPAMLLAPIRDDWQIPAELEVVALSDQAGIEAYVAADGEEEVRHSTREEQDRALAKAVMGMPGIRLLVGRIQGQPVARSMVVVSGEMAGVTNVYVAPSVRRRGLGAAVTAAAVRAGRELGATAACLEATPMGEPLYRAMGFRELYRYVRMGR